MVDSVVWQGRGCPGVTAAPTAEALQKIPVPPGPTEAPSSRRGEDTYVETELSNPPGNSLDFHRYLFSCLVLFLSSNMETGWLCLVFSPKDGPPLLRIFTAFYKLSIDCF